MVASAVFAALAPLRVPRADAFPTQPALHLTPTPSGAPQTAPPAQSSTMLPYGSRLTFVLDGTISSASSRANQVVNAHLKRALVLGGTTVAPAGAPVRIRILDASPASNPDIYGFVDIYFEPLRLSDGRELPLRAPISHLNVNSSAGHDSTVAVENTVGDIFAPTLLLHVFRKGRNFTLEPGADVHALTEARVDIGADGTVAVATPPPLILDSGMPRASFQAVPLATPAGNPGQAPVPLIQPSMRPTMTPFPGTRTPPPLYQTPSP